MKKLIQSFTAQDKNGKKYQIDCYQTFHTSHTWDGPETLAGMKEYRYGTGAVNVIDENTFQILQTDTEVKKIR
jgi:hypothetical protein